MKVPGFTPISYEEIPGIGEPVCSKCGWVMDNEGQFVSMVKGSKLYHRACAQGRPLAQATSSTLR